MSDLNTLTISGRLTKDPIARRGGSVAALSLASNRQYQKDDEWIEEVVFVDVTAFGTTAKRCIERLMKGAAVTVAGRLELNRYQDAEGNNRSQLRVIANQILSPSFQGRRPDPDEPTVEDAALARARDLAQAQADADAEDNGVPLVEAA